MKELRCRDAGFDCEAVVRGDTMDEVMAQARPHAEEVHGLRVTPEMAGQLRALVRDT
ncbi:DUF1059 domain-containing protein [Blastococcus sp. CCUG 61487]|uniref:DUF1059 domain-containing protein n=1 Tax=Blastococcus sp. CCUG 61487 TaxID=1840703 RepID=UPI0010BFB785|nr:DUF1059 domain-containing protein [Blastococcus sp. CCUG 61487]